MPSKAYTTLIGLVLASIGIMYEGSDINPFKRSPPTTLLFLTAIFCHALASMADMSMQTSIIIIFQLSGGVACETLLWILLAEIWWCYVIINLLLLMLASFCFSISIRNISQLLCSTGSNAEQMQNLEPQEAQIM